MIQEVLLLLLLLHCSKFCCCWCLITLTLNLNLLTVWLGGWPYISKYVCSARCCLLRLLRVYVCVCVSVCMLSTLFWSGSAQQSLSSKASSALLVTYSPSLYYYYHYTLWDSSVTLQRGSISVVALGVLLLSEDFQDVNETALCVVFVKQYTPYTLGIPIILYFRIPTIPIPSNIYISKY